MHKTFVGIDLHKRRCVYAEIDADGNLLRRGSFGNNIEEVSRFALGLGKDTHLVVEPVLNYLWFLDQVEEYTASVHVADPYRTRVIAEAKCKTDRYDCLMLAELLRVNFLAESYIPPKPLRVLRDLVRQRYYLVREAARQKNRIRYILATKSCEVTARDVSSPKGRCQLQHLPLPDSSRLAVEQCLDVIDNLRPKIKLLEHRIASCCGDNSQIELLRTIPGIGRVLAVIIYAETGEIGRFRSAKAYASYTGLVPTVRASGDHVVMGGITKRGSRPLRYALVEAALTAHRASASLARLYGRVLFKSNVQKARVAVAHRLAIIIYAMLTRAEPFRVQS